MNIALWVTMTLHVGAFLFWVAAAVATISRQKKKEAELQKQYSKAIENANAIAHEANQQYIRFKFHGDGPDEIPIK